MKSSVVRILSLTAVLVGAAVSQLGTVALAGELSGVTLPDTLKAGDKMLKLNGLGLRKKAMFKVYVGGCTSSPTSSAASSMAA